MSHNSAAAAGSGTVPEVEVPKREVPDREKAEEAKVVIVAEEDAVEEAVGGGLEVPPTVVVSLRRLAVPRSSSRLTMCPVMHRSSILWR